MYDVVPAAVAEQVPEDAEAEHDGRQQSASAAPRVQAEAGPDGDYADTGDVGLAASIPLPQCQERDFVPLRGERLRDVTGPALRSSDRVREQTVVDDADLHGAYPSSRSGRGRICTADDPRLSGHPVSRRGGDDRGMRYDRALRARREPPRRRGHR